MSEQNVVAVEQQEETQVADAAFQKDITDSVFRRISNLEKSNGIKLPEGYNPGNALKAAYLKLQTVVDKNKKLAIKVCTRESIINSLFDMCIQGLSPAKNQCYFIVRGDELTLMRSYFGTVAVLKRLKGVDDVFAQVVYKGDVFEYAIEGGNVMVTKHEQKLENINLDSIIGAYCVIVKNGKPRCEIMTMAQIRQAWSHTTNGGGVQREFPDQMAKRTVINRGAKMYVNTSDDDDELIEAINNSTEAEYVADPTENGDPVSLPAPQQALPEKPIVIDSEAVSEAVAEYAATERRKPGF